MRARACVRTTRTRALRAAAAAAAGRGLGHRGGSESGRRGAGSAAGRTEAGEV